MTSEQIYSKQERLNELADDVAALREQLIHAQSSIAETIVDLQFRFENRISALESRVTPAEARESEPVCAKCQHEQSWHADGDECFHVELSGERCACLSFMGPAPDPEPAAPPAPVNAEEDMRQQLMHMLASAWDNTGDDDLRGRYLRAFAYIHPYCYRTPEEIVRQMRKSILEGLDSHTRR